MIKLLTVLFLMQSVTAAGQSKVDVAVAKLKRLWSESARYPTPEKIYFNKTAGLIDVGEGEEYQIPIDSGVVYVYDLAYTPPGHTLKFSWSTPNPDQSPLVPGSHAIKREFELLFKTKDECYNLIDAIFELRKAFQE